MDRAQRLIFILLIFFTFPDLVRAANSAGGSYADQGLAYSACLAYRADSNDTYEKKRTGGNSCSLVELSNSAYYNCTFPYRNPDNNYSGITGCGSYYFPINNKCGSRPAESWSSRSPDIAAMNGAISCRNGCTALNTMLDSGDNGTGPTYFSSDFLNGTCDTFPHNCEQYGSGWYFNWVHLACMPPQKPCPDGQSKGTNGKCKEACPAGMVEQPDGTCKPKASECPAGQVKAPDGSCIDNGQCPAGQTKGADGTCKPSKPEDPPDNCPAGQKADANGKCQYDESFSGGDDCSMPPTCSGSPILCGQARIQWRIDCNTRKNTNVSGGTCASVPVCTGEKCDAVEYAQLIQQWKTACALEKLAAGGATDPGDTSGQPDWTKVAGMSQDPGAGASGDDTKVLTDKAVDLGALDQSGLGGGACMGFVTATGGDSLSGGFLETMASPPPIWCQYIDNIKAIVILLASVTAAFILAKGSAS